MLCSACKTDNPADAAFCFRCGTRMGSPPPEDPSTGTLLAIEAGTPGGGPLPSTRHQPTPRGESPPGAVTPYKVALGFAGPANRYELLEVLGHGGMGAVFKARDNSLGRIVALKRIKYAGASEDSYLRFTREAQNFAKMLHPHIVTLFDYGRDDHGPYLVMEYVEGEPLNVRLARRGALPPEQAVGIFVGIAAGVDHAHGKGVVHRDIKPANVIIDPSGTPKLLDFGLAREGVDSEMSQTGWFLGTPDYAAPEQKRDAKSVDARADIYAMGVVLYEMLTGLRPVPLHLPKLPGRWQPVVTRAVEPEPKDRYATVADFLAEVRAVPLDAPPSVPARPAASNELACPECGTDNTLEAVTCTQCNAPLTTPCVVCNQPRRVGLRNCGHCGASAVVASIAVTHRQRAERALALRAWKEALNELTELDFLLTRSSDMLGPAANWFDWVRAGTKTAKQAIDQARKLASSARETAQRGMLGAAARKLAQAAQIDPVFEQEHRLLAEQAGVAPGVPGSDSGVEPDHRTSRFDDLTSGSRAIGGTARPDSSKARTGPVPPSRPTISRANLRVRCNACKAGFLTRQDVIAKQKACPKCGVEPFSWTAQP